MTCTVCVNYYDASEVNVNVWNQNLNLKGQKRFLIGCSNRKISSVLDHEKSNIHLKALEASEAKKEPVDNSEALKTLRTLKQADCDKLKILHWNEIFSLSRDN